MGFSGACSFLIHPLRSARTSLTILQEGGSTGGGGTEAAVRHARSLLFLHTVCRVHNLNAPCIPTMHANNTSHHDASHHDATQQCIRPPKAPHSDPPTHFFSSHLDGMKRRLGSGAALSGITSTSRVNQSTSGS